MKAIVLAAGKGRRFASESESSPKVMRNLGGIPMIERVMHALSFIPKKDTVIVVGYGKDAVKARLGSEYNYVLQEPQLGTGHAVMCAEDFAQGEGDVLVCYADMPLLSRQTFEGIIEAHKKSGADCTALTAIAPNSDLHYGRIVREGGRFTEIIEYRDANEEQKKINELNVGVYVFKTEVLFYAIKKLGLNNYKKEYLLTDVPNLLLKQGSKLETYTTYNSNEIYGVNTEEDLALCGEIYTHIAESARLKRQTRWFGTGGWRAIIGDDFTKANVRILSQAIADDMKSKGYKEIVIGRDRRFLSDKAAAWAAEVFAGNNITVYFITKEAPTPLIMFTVKQYGAKYGLAVTASHNPADYNGIKVFTEGGRDAAIEVTDIFEGIISQGVTPASVDFSEGMQSGKIHVIDPVNDYIDSIIAMSDMDAIRANSKRILIDPMFGVSKTTLQTILMTARCDIDIINDRRDTLFGGRLPSPSAATLAKLRDMVAEQGYDLGIATDGDADRIGIIDSEGRFVHPNEILMLLYYYLLKHKGWRGDCVRNIATTHVLDKIAEDFTLKCHEVPVGFKNISSKMEETDALIGGESSGGLTIRGHIKGKDGIFASTLIVEMLCRTKKTISELLKEIQERYGKTYMAEFDASFSEAKKSELKKLLFEDKKLPDLGFETEKVSYADGCKMYFKNGGWIIMRFSGTEPLLRIFCEMEDMNTAEECILKTRKFLGI
ncbi:MAG: NTP transferase domain-containing protein [Clostridiales bacterium]|jgi:phosphomannomutase/UTP-glucose-1-phosphate uridylyltransferase|nr:NTP transferase domain-containing protein [Clostridiales bacterium]